jgi:hypothetical protein
MSAIDIATLLTITGSVYEAAKATSRSVAIGLLRQIEECQQPVAVHCPV